MSISVIFFTPLSVDTTLELLSYTSIRHIHLGFAKWYKSIGAVARERLVKEYRDPLGQRFAGYVKFFTFELLNLCPHHGFENWHLASHIYEGLLPRDRQFVKSMCNGNFMQKDPDDALEFLDEIAEKAHQWTVPSPVSPVETTDRSRIATSSTNKGIYQLKEEDDWKLKFEIGHIVKNCPIFQEMKGAYKEHCAAVGNFKQQYSPFSNTYNPATRNHPNFCWSNEPQPQLGLGELKPTAMKLQLVDHSIQMPRGVIEDVSVQVDKFYYPVDFVVLDTQPVLHSENEIPVILGRPFLATCDTHISCRSGVDKWRPRFEKLPPRKEKTLPSNVEVPKLELKPYLRDLNMHSWGPTTLFYW
ncbi:unnamed protein product [Prunus armeniaca]